VKPISRSALLKWLAQSLVSEKIGTFPASAVCVTVLHSTPRPCHPSIAELDQHDFRRLQSTITLRSPEVRWLHGRSDFQSRVCFREFEHDCSTKRRPPAGPWNGPVAVVQCRASNRPPCFPFFVDSVSVIANHFGLTAHEDHQYLSRNEGPFKAVPQDAGRGRTRLFLNGGEPTAGKPRALSESVPATALLEIPVSSRISICHTELRRCEACLWCRATQTKRAERKLGEW